MVYNHPAGVVIPKSLLLRYSKLLLSGPLFHEILVLLSGGLVEALELRVVGFRRPAARLQVLGRVAWRVIPMLVLRNRLRWYHGSRVHNRN